MTIGSCVGSKTQTPPINRNLSTPFAVRLLEDRTFVISSFRCHFLFSFFIMSSGKATLLLCQVVKVQYPPRNNFTWGSYTPDDRAMQGIHEIHISPKVFWLLLMYSSKSAGLT